MTTENQFKNSMFFISNSEGKDLNFTSSDFGFDNERDNGGMMPPILEESKDMDESKLQKDSIIKKSRFDEEDYDLSSKFDLRKDFPVELN